MTFPIYTVQDLANFATQPVELFDPTYANTHITQASLLLRLATCLTEPPSDPTLLELFKNAVLDMALKLDITAKYREAKYSPFATETIGSYSYGIALAKIKEGEDTGVMWFDLAVAQMGVCDFMGGSGVASSGGIEVFEHDGSFVPGSHPGNERLLSPNDIGSMPPFNLWGR